MLTIRTLTALSIAGLALLAGPENANVAQAPQIVQVANAGDVDEAMPGQEICGVTATPVRLTDVEVAKNAYMTNLLIPFGITMDTQLAAVTASPPGTTVGGGTMAVDTNILTQGPPIETRASRAVDVDSHFAQVPSAFVAATSLHRVRRI